MRREDFTVDVRGVDWVDADGGPEQPTLTIEYDGRAGALRDRLTAPGGEPLDAGETDVSFRLTSNMAEDDAAGVVGITDRLTGDFVLEANVDAAVVFDFIRAARRYGEHEDSDGQYRIRISAGGEELGVYEKRTFLVYNDDGDLLRDQSLIPGGVEL